MNDIARPVIMLEDDATLRSLMAEVLAEAGYPVTDAATGPDVAAALAQMDGRAILVADRSVDTGGQNGFQIASEALDRYPALRVIYITGTHIAIRRRTLGERERGLLKPFAMAQLLAAVRDLSS